MRIVLLGAPGSGKGTQARLLEKRYRVPQISTGDLLREAVAAGNSLGKKAKKKMDSGELVPDELVFELIRERLNRKDARRGAVLDGFPRSIPQAQKLDGLLSMVGQPVQVALLVEVDDESLIKRLTGRRNCTKCGAICNIHFSPPAKTGICDTCSGKLISRSDDKAQTVRNRLQVYRDQTAPLVTYYRAQHKLRTVRATGEIGAIHEKICDILDLEIRPLEIKTLDIAAESHDEESGTVIAGGKVTKTVALREKPSKRSPAGTKIRAASNSAATGTQATAAKSKKKSVVRKKPATKSIANKSAPSKTKTAVRKNAPAKKVTEKKPRPVTKKSGSEKKSTPVNTRKTVKKKAAQPETVKKKKPGAKTTPKRAKTGAVVKAGVKSKPAAAKKSADKKAQKKGPSKKKAPSKKPKKAAKKGDKNK